MGKARFIFVTVGLVLIIFGLVLFNALIVGFQKPLSVMQGNAFQADFSPESPTIHQGQSVTFSITNLTPYNSYDSVSQLGSCNWKIDGILVDSSGSTAFTYVGTTVGTHTVEVALSFMYNNWQSSDTLIGYTTVTVLANSPNPTPTIHPTSTPTFHPTASPTPIGQTPHPTTNPTQAPIIPVPKSNTELILMVMLGALMEVGGTFCILMSRRF